MKGEGKREERRMTGEKRNDNYQKISRCYAKERWKKKKTQRDSDRSAESRSGFNNAEVTWPKRLEELLTFCFLRVKRGLNENIVLISRGCWLVVVVVIVVDVAFFLFFVLFFRVNSVVWCSAFVRRPLLPLFNSSFLPILLISFRDPSTNFYPSLCFSVASLSNYFLFLL